ncbi:TrmH family RNA methyltransferase [Sedimenticola sp.]|uniref:TrmH family RNA methyltransferase n=1 Tax=Sedimenticola sp. TaxID=1940285 RepID=UPI003D0B68CB
MPLRKSKKSSRNQAILRYKKQRQRNRLANPGLHRFILVLDHLKAGFNVPKIFRSAEAFGAREVHLVDIGMFDPAPGKGSFKKVPARFYETFEQSYAELKARGYSLFILEAGSGESLYQAQLPEKCAFVLGHEERGISFDPDTYPDIQRLSIPQFGQVESLNVSIAASIVMYEFVRQQGDLTAAITPPEREEKLRRKESDK